MGAHPGAESEAASRLDALLVNAESQARSADADDEPGTDWYEPCTASLFRAPEGCRSG